MRVRLVPTAFLAAGLVLAPGCSAANRIKEVANAAKDIEKDTNELDAKLKAAAKLTFTATYETREGSDAPKTYRVVQQPPKGAYLTEDSSLIDDGTQLASCSRSAGTWTCRRVGDHSDGGFFGGAFAAYGVASPLAFLPGLRAAAAIAGFTTKRDKESFAGQDSDCVTFDKSGSDGGHFKYCTTADGILALTEDGKSTTKLAAYKSSVDAKDLEPPAKVKASDDDTPDASSTTAQRGSTTTSTTEDDTTTTTESSTTSEATTSTTS